MNTYNNKEVSVIVLSRVGLVIKEQMNDNTINWLYGKDRDILADEFQELAN